MTRCHIRQLQKLEAALLAQPAKLGLRAMTSDELDIHLLELLPRLAEDPTAHLTERDEAVARIAEIEVGIRLQAARRPNREHAAQLADLKRVGRDTINYVPAVTPAGEHDSLDTPPLMERRIMLWARSDVLAVLARKAA